MVLKLSDADSVLFLEHITSFWNGIWRKEGRKEEKENRNKEEKGNKN